jgi:hypothetical protein
MIQAILTLFIALSALLFSVTALPVEEIVEDVPDVTAVHSKVLGRDINVVLGPPTPATLHAGHIKGRDSVGCTGKQLDMYELEGVLTDLCDINPVKPLSWSWCCYGWTFAYECNVRRVLAALHRY